MWTNLSHTFTMTKPCAAPGCLEATAGYSTLCHQHKQVQRRHGHAAQVGVTVHALRPYGVRVAARRAKNRDSNAWVILGQRWEVVVEHSRQTLANFGAGQADLRHSVQAAEQVRNLADSVPPEAVVQTALAMFLYRDDQPRRFRSDRAFDFQLVRRVRGLSTLNAGTYWDGESKRNKMVYRDLPPRTTEALAGALKDAFGLAGVMLAGKERQEAALAHEDQHRLAQALEALS